MASVKEPLRSRRHDDVDLERDRALVERCQAGDSSAFDDLYLRYRERLFRSCLRRTGNTSEAEDLVQETFVRAWKAMPTFAGERRFYPWLSVIANNLCADIARRGGRCVPVEEKALDLIAPAVAAEQEAIIEKTGDLEILTQALERLSERHREVLELRESRNWTYQQIAAHAGVEVSTIETLLFRARRSLKREFLTLSRAETGLAGLLLLPLTAIRRLLRRSKHVLRHPAFGAKLASAVSSIPIAPVLGGAAVLVGAAAVTAGAFAGAHGGAPSRGEATSARSVLLGAPQQRAAALEGSTQSAFANAMAARRDESARHLTSRSGAASRHSRVASKSTAPSLGGTASGAQETISGSTASALAGLNGAIHKVSQALGGTVGSLGGTVAGASGGVSSGVSSVTGGVTGGVSSVTGGVSGGVSSITGGISSIAGGALGGGSGGGGSGGGGGGGL